MSAPWTPGPWCVSVDDYGDVVVDPVGSEERVCTVGRNAQGTRASVANFGHFDTPEVRADAALIAAAPDMFEALELALQHAERHAHNYLGGDSLKRASEELQPARDALAKARGDTQSIIGRV